MITNFNIDPDLRDVHTNAKDVAKRFWDKIKKEGTL